MSVARGASLILTLFLAVLLSAPLATAYSIQGAGGGDNMPPWEDVADGCLTGMPPLAQPEQCKKEIEDIVVWVLNEILGPLT